MKMIKIYTKLRNRDMIKQNLDDNDNHHSRIANHKSHSRTCNETLSVAERWAIICMLVDGRQEKYLQVRIVYGRKNNNMHAMGQ